MRVIFCPSCGQQQASKETKFCSKCGLLLTGVQMLLDNGGAVPVLEKQAVGKVLNKRNGVVLSLAWFIFFTMFLTAIFGTLRAPQTLVAILAITGIFGGLLSMILSLAFLPSSKDKTKTIFTFVDPSSGNEQTPLRPASALPLPQPAAVESAFKPRSGMWLDTTELKSPQETEARTKMLSEDEYRQ